MNKFKNILALAALAFGAISMPVLAQTEQVVALGSAPSVASVTAESWGAPVVFNFQAAAEQGVIAPRTATLRTVKLSPTNPTLKTYESEWRAITNFANIVRVQFRTGDPAYAAVNAWTQARNAR